MKRTFWETERWGRVPIADAKKRRQIAVLQQDIDCATAGVPAIAHALRRAVGTRDVRVTPGRVYTMGTDPVFLRYERPPPISAPCSVWLTPVPARPSQAKPRLPEAPDARMEAEEVPPDPPQVEAPSAPQTVIINAGGLPGAQQTSMGFPAQRTFQDAAHDVLEKHLVDLFPQEIAFCGAMMHRERRLSASKQRRLRSLCLRFGVALWPEADQGLELVHDSAVEERPNQQTPKKATG